MAMAITPDPKVRPYYWVTFFYEAYVTCEDCEREIEYSSTHPRDTEENWYEAAVAMRSAGWVVVQDCTVAAAWCPSCAAKRGWEPSSGAI
jgi:hypothetical protein